MSLLYYQLPSDSSLSSCVANAGQMGGTYGGYLEQAELIDKRVDQLTREKRDLLSKNLEENKERIEISQKLIASEREVRNLKAKVTKMVLEKERAERRAANMAVAEAAESPEKKIPSGLKRSREENTENIENF
jgi:NAD(P)H-dependent flavin oxidoreductase YrpB (nitropropane dioxygenase family)